MERTINYKLQVLDVPVRLNRANAVLHTHVLRARAFATPGSSEEARLKGWTEEPAPPLQPAAQELAGPEAGFRQALWVGMYVPAYGEGGPMRQEDRGQSANTCVVVTSVPANQRVLRVVCPPETTEHRFYALTEVVPDLGLCGGVQISPESVFFFARYRDDDRRQKHDREKATRALIGEAKQRLRDGAQEPASPEPPEPVEEPAAPPQEQESDPPRAETNDANDVADEAAGGFVVQCPNFTRLLWRQTIADDALCWLARGELLALWPDVAPRFTLDSLFLLNWAIRRSDNIVLPAEARTFLVRYVSRTEANPFMSPGDRQALAWELWEQLWREIIDSWDLA